MWNCVNFVAEQLASLEDPHGVLAVVLLPDASLGAGGVDAKEMLKAELVHFICKTAREFAVRRTRQADPRAISGLDVRGFVQDAAHFNATWLRLPFDNDGEPVFSCSARGGRRWTSSCGASIARRRRR